jgi:alpha-glucosidase (family GH31 glycosyl hydrolase)
MFKKYFILFSLVFIIYQPIFGQNYLGNFTSYHIEGRKINIKSGESSIQLTFYLPEIVKVDFLPQEKSLPDSSFTVIMDTTAIVNFTVNDYDSILTFSSSKLKILFTKFPIRISIYNSNDELLIKEPIEGGLATNESTRIANFILNTSEHFYGTGERGTDLDKRGQTFSTYNMPVYGYTSPQTTMNINIPLLCSTKGYALFFDNTYPGRFDLGSTFTNKYFYRSEGGELTYYFIAAETVQKQIELYTKLTGRQPLPPKWAFGFIQSKFGYRNESEARNTIQVMREKKFPCDALVLDLYWFKNMGDLQWDNTRFPNPTKLMQDLKSQGIKTILISEPYITEYSTNFSEVINQGYIAKNSLNQPYYINNWWACGCRAVLMDITDPAAQSWLWNKYIQFMGNEVGGLWTDLGEPENHPSGMVHYLGSANKVHNIYNLLWAKIIYEGFNQFRPNERLFNLTRSGFAGIQKYGVIPWSGDVGKSFKGLEVQLPMLLNMGISGLAYHNSDIGGFCCGNTTPELYIRWMQYGVFCPITRAHGTGQPTEPWGYGDEAENISREFIQLRYKLLPYNYTLAYQNYLNGTPIARPLFFDYPDDKVYNMSSSYLWGSSLLVSPVVQENQTYKEIYLPFDEWYDFWTDKVYKGGNTYNFSTPLNQIPLFVKAGSIIPMQPVFNYTDEFPIDTLFLLIYPSKKKQAFYSLYEDDGKTLDYQKGYFALTNFGAITTLYGDSLSIRIDIGKINGLFNGMPERRVYLSEVHGIDSRPKRVSKDDVTLIEKSSYQELRSAYAGYYYDANGKILFIHSSTGKDSAIKISIDNVLITKVSNEQPNEKNYYLDQNYPNPFNSDTKIKFSLSQSGYVSLKVYDVLGKIVADLINEKKNAGIYELEFNGANLPSGIYFYILRSEKINLVKKMVLMK